MTTAALARDGLNTINARRPLDRFSALNAAHSNPLNASQPLDRFAALNTARTSRATRGAGVIGESFDLNAARMPAPASAGITTPSSFRAAMDAIAAAKKPAPADMPASEQDAKLRATAETLVNQIFMGTMLKRMRSSPFKDQTMSGGKAGDAYAGLFDQHLAANAGGGMGKGLVDVMVKHLKGLSRQAPPADLTNAQNEYRRNAGKEQPHVAAAVNRAA